MKIKRVILLKVIGHRDRARGIGSLRALFDQPVHSQSPYIRACLVSVPTTVLS